MNSGRRVQQVVQDPNEAEFVLAHGTEALGGGDFREPLPCSVAEMESLLERCARRTDRRVPLIVANPDFVTVDGRDLRVMPGSLGRFYQRLGGQVRQGRQMGPCMIDMPPAGPLRCRSVVCSVQVLIMGKPDPVIYRAAEALLPAGAPCVAIGDSLEHDIAGTTSAYFDCYAARVTCQ